MTEYRKFSEIETEFLDVVYRDYYLMFEASTHEPISKPLPVRPSDIKMTRTAEEVLADPSFGM